MNTAIIVAAGSGKRFGSDTPKQFLSILGKPLIIHTLERFEHCGSISEIILVLDEDKISEFTKVLKEFNIDKLKRVVPGGETRTESVRNGFVVILGSEGDIVAVHDGARPLISIQDITKTIESAEENGAACLVGEVTDTIKEVEHGKIKRTVDRSTLKRALTPQCFRYEILAEAFLRDDWNEMATDECYLVEKLGYGVASVEGDAKNIKITRKEDLEVAEVLLREMLRD